CIRLTRTMASGIIARAFRRTERAMTATASASSRTYNPISGTACVPPTFATDLDVLAPYAVAICDDARALVVDLSDARFNWKPAPERWSIAQCLKHLVLTGTFAVDGQEAAIARLKQQSKLFD